MQVCRWLGHHDPGFTLRTYVHLLEEGVGEALDLDAELASARSSASHQGVGPDQLTSR